jgi:hypothetical protein
MCTLHCPYCVFTLCISIGIHLVSFQDSVIIRIYLSNCFEKNSILPIICLIVHYYDTGNVFQVFRSCSSVTCNRIIKQVNKHNTSKRFAPDSGLALGFQRPIAIIITKPGYKEPISPNWVEEGENLLTLLNYLSPSLISFSKITKFTYFEYDLVVYLSYFLFFSNLPFCYAILVNSLSLIMVASLKITYIFIYTVGKTMAMHLTYAPLGPLPTPIKYIIRSSDTD